MELIKVKGDVKFLQDENGISFQQIGEETPFETIVGAYVYRDIKTVNNNVIKYHLNGSYGFSVWNGETNLTGGNIWTLAEAEETANELTMIRLNGNKPITIISISELSNMYDSGSYCNLKVTFEDDRSKEYAGIRDTGSISVWIGGNNDGVVNYGYVCGIKTIEVILSEDEKKALYTHVKEHFNI